MRAKCLWSVLCAGSFVAVVGLSLAAERKEKEEQEKVFNFSKADLGKVPNGWTVAKTGKGEGSVWKVVADDTSLSKTGYVLAQTAEGPNRLFNLCIANGANYTDVEVSVAMKAVAGKIDQGGGPVWRYQDADNYYIARYNPLETNYRLYKVVNGKRIQLVTKEGLDHPADQWITLKIQQKGEVIECYLDGKKLLEAKDGSIQSAGKVGLWTKADAQTRFDRLEVKAK